jgi:hypothetical protein
MAALAAVMSHATGIEIDVDTLRSTLIFCAAGLAFSLLLIAHGFDLGAASAEGAWRSQTSRGGATRHTRDKLRCYPIGDKRRGTLLRGTPMADDDIDTLMKARAALARTRLSWAQAIAAPGAIPERAINAIVEVQRAIDVIDRAIEEQEEADELEAEEEE